jgi:hypothetical protein
MVLVQNLMAHSRLPTLGFSILYELESQIILGLPSLNAWKREKFKIVNKAIHERPTLLTIVKSGRS